MLSKDIFVSLTICIDQTRRAVVIVLPCYGALEIVGVIIIITHMHRYCNVSPGWPASTCDADYVRRNCPAMCKLCTEDPDAVDGQCPTVYGPGAHSTASASTTFNVLLPLISIFIIISIYSFNNS